MESLSEGPTEFAEGSAAPPSGPIADRLTDKRWNWRSDAYAELEREFRVPEAPESLFNEYADIIKKIVADVHPTAQERALETATAFFLFAPVATCRGIGASTIKNIADKCLGGRPGARSKSQDTLLAMIESEMATEVVDAMIARFQAKLPKLVVAAIQVLRAALMSFGPKVISSKTVIKAVIPLFEHGDPGVRTEVSGIVIDFYRWAGSAIKTHIENLRSAQVTELEKSFEGITPGEVPITRWLRSQKPDPASAAAAAMSKPLLSTLDFVDAVNVLAKLPKNWPAAVLEKEKWTERKELLDALVSAASVPKIAPDNYSEVKLIFPAHSICSFAHISFAQFIFVSQVMRSLKRLFNDPMIVVATLAVKAVGLLAAGLGSEFSHCARIALPCILEKLKDKNKGMVEAALAALDAIVPACIKVADILEELSEVINCKVPPARVHAMTWSSKFLVALSIKLSRPIVESVVKATDDAAPEVRECALMFLSTCCSVYGIDNMTKGFLDKLDAKRVKRITEGSAAASSSAASRLSGDSDTLSKQPVRPMTAPARTISAAPIKTEPKERVSLAPVGALKAKPAISGSKSTTAAGSTGAKSSKAEDVVVSSMSEEEAASAATQFFPADAIAQIASKDWKERLVGMEALLAWATAENAGALTGQQVEAAVIHVGKLLMSWKESNFQVISKAFTFIAQLAAVNAAFPSRLLSIICPPLTDKIADIKIKSSVCAALSSVCEVVHSHTVIKYLCSSLAEQKNPRVLQEIAAWIQSVCIEFGGECIPVKVVIEAAKNVLLDHQNPLVKTATVKMLGSIRQFVGPSISDALSDIKPALLATITEEFAKVSLSSLPAPTRTVRYKSVGPSSATASKTAELVTRTDISDAVEPLLGELEKAEWKSRQDALLAIEKILQQSSYCIQPSCSSLIASLKLRLKDSNKVVATQTLTLLTALARSFGPGGDVYSRQVLPGVLAHVGDGKKSVQDSAVSCLDAWSDALGAEKTVSSVIFAVEPDSPAVRACLFSWISNRWKAVSGCKDMHLLAKPIVEGVINKAAEVRGPAEQLFTLFVTKFGSDPVRSQIRNLKPAQAKDVEAFLEKVEIANNTRPKSEKEVKEDKENARHVVQSALPNVAISTAAGAVAKKSLQFERESVAPAPAAPEVLCMNSNDGKEKRTGKDKRGRTITADTVAEAAEQLVSLREQFGRCASEPMLSRLFASDFKKVVEGCNALLAQMSESASGRSAVLECSDLVIKWCVLRLYEGSNSQVVSRVFDVLNCLLDAFEEASKHLDETEANNLITCLCERVGVNQESLRQGIRSLIKKLPKVVAPSRLYACILETAVKTKNMRSRSDCLDEMAVLVDAHGVEVAGSMKTLAVIAAFVASSSADVRNSALTLLTSFYLPMGDKVHRSFLQQSTHVVFVWSLFSAGEQVFRNSRQRPQEPHCQSIQKYQER
jgi:cytoskeleton-associated protein 5